MKIEKKTIGDTIILWIFFWGQANLYRQIFITLYFPSSYVIVDGLFKEEVVETMEIGLNF